jgi:quercetin dioxygenase-like cupin family protein
MDQIQTPEGYSVANSPEAQERYKRSLELAKHGLKPILNPPFVNMPPQKAGEGYRSNIILDNKHINNITFISLDSNAIIEKHYHKENYHYILVTRGKLLYYEKPVLSNQGVYFEQIKAGSLLYVGPMLEHQLTCDERTDFYMFSNKGLTDELIDRDVYPISYDLKNFPIISRPQINSEVEFIKRH